MNDFVYDYSLPSTDGAPPPQYTTAPPDCALHEFSQLTTDDVVAAVRQLVD